MKLFEKITDRSICWWCGSTELSQEHKYKKTDLEILYGKSYPESKRISGIKFRTESTGKYLQSSNSNTAKFQPIICIKCNNAKSQNFDQAYERLISYYYNHQEEIHIKGKIDLKCVFGNSWNNEILNVERYIAKHVGCRIAENGFKPLPNVINFLNGKEPNNDLKIVFQLKQYLFGEINDPLECIFLGPITPINISQDKSMDIVTSFSGWYTFVNLSWNYLLEENTNFNRRSDRLLSLDIIKYDNPEILNIQLRKESLEKDWGFGLERVEYFPFEGNTRDLDHYKYIKDF